MTLAAAGESRRPPVSRQRHQPGSDVSRKAGAHWRNINILWRSEVRPSTFPPKLMFKGTVSNRNRVSTVTQQPGIIRIVRSTKACCALKTRRHVSGRRVPGVGEALHAFLFFLPTPVCLFATFKVMQYEKMFPINWDLTENDFTSVRKEPFFCFFLKTEPNRMKV